MQVLPLETGFKLISLKNYHSLFINWSLICNLIGKAKHLARERLSALMTVVYSVQIMAEVELLFAKFAVHTCEIPAPCCSGGRLKDLKTKEEIGRPWPPLTVVGNVDPDGHC